MELVLGSLKDARVDLERIRIVPFPINKPELLKYYVPLEAVHMITVFDDWGTSKVEKLRQRGLQVKIIEMRKVTTGTEVRRRFLTGQSLNNLVPPYVIDFLEREGRKYLSPHDATSL